MHFIVILIFYHYVIEAMVMRLIISKKKLATGLKLTQKYFKLKLLVFLVMLLFFIQQLFFLITRVQYNINWREENEPFRTIVFAFEVFRYFALLAIDLAFTIINIQNCRIIYKLFLKQKNFNHKEITLLPILAIGTAYALTVLYGFVMT